jgi:hypothetical protein
MTSLTMPELVLYLLESSRFCWAASWRARATNTHQVVLYWNSEANTAPVWLSAARVILVRFFRGYTFSGQNKS